MLRGMVFENFVHFEKRFVLDFSKKENGPNIFVGVSSTGKTAVLELIRRCMDIKINSSLTNRFNESETAWVFCEFGLENGKYGPTVISGMIVDGTQPLPGNDTGSIENDEEDEECVPKVKGDHKDTMFHKVITYFCESKIIFFSKTYLKKPDGKIVDLNKNLTFGQDILLGLVYGQTNEDNLVSDGIKELFNCKFAETVSKKIRQRQNNNDTYDRYPKVWEELQSRFVGVLSMRGLGTFQWTKSLLIDDKFKSVNYEGTCAQAEIITELIGSEDIDERKEKEIFEFLTRPNEFLFKKELNSTTNVNEIFVEHKTKRFPLLKTSVGIVEAKQFSLLMAHKSFQTICLEEPDRGMHPQMIERMKMELYRKDQSKSKTIIIVTHSPYLIDSFSLENTFIFFSIEERDKKASYVKNVSNLRNSIKTLKIIANEDLKKILFSTKVLVVEGKTDKTILHAVFRHCFKDAKEYSQIMSHQIISMEGKEFKDAICEFCTQINVKCRLLLDRDAFIDVDGNGIITKFKYKNEIYVDYVNKPITNFLIDSDGFQKFSDELKENKKAFIWKNGDLEDFLLSKTKKRSDICNLLGVTIGDDIPILKQRIKKALKKGLSQRNEVDLATIIKNFDDISRLESFLKD